MDSNKKIELSAARKLTMGFSYIRSALRDLESDYPTQVDSVRSSLHHFAWSISFTLPASVLPNFYRK